MSKRPAYVALFAMFLQVVSPALLRAAPTPGPMAMPSDEALAANAPAASLAAPEGGAPKDEEVRAQVDALNARYRRVDYDPAARAAELGDGVEPAFNLVRDEVRFEAYPGVLRGARGAYASRAANAADRALLLAELLKAKNVATRFVRGRLAREQAEALFARMFEPAPAASQPQQGASPADSPRGKAMAERLKARATRDFAAIRQALGDRAPQASATDREAVLREIVPHVWVQAKVDNAWVDLDPSFADATPGKQYCRPEQTLDKLPDDLHQHVTVRVRTEKLTGEKLATETVLELKRPAVDLIDRQVFLFHAPEMGGGGLGGIGGGVATGNWMPVLWVDGALTRGKAFSFKDEEAKKGRDGGGLAGFGGFGGALGGGGGGGGAKAADGGTKFVAEVIEFEIAAPGGTKETIRRALVDRADPAWRKTTPPEPDKLAPLPADDKGPTAVHTIHNVWFSGGRHDLSSYARAMKVMVDAAASPAPGDAAPNRKPDPSDVFWPVALQNLPAVLWGDHALIPALNDDPGVRFYVDSPRVLMFSATPTPVAGRADQVEIELVTDLRRDKVRGVAKDDGTAAAVARRKIWYGALAGALEHELGAQQLAAIGAGGAAVASTSALLGGDGAVVLRPDEKRDAADWQSLAAHPATAAALAADLERGQTLVVPKSVLARADASTDVGAGWWAIDADGHTRAVWGPDLHAMRGKSPLNMPTQRPSGTVHYIFDDGSSYTKKVTDGGGGGSGEEYANILMEISIGSLEVTLTYGHAAVASALFGVAVILHGVFIHEP